MAPRPSQLEIVRAMQSLNLLACLPAATPNRGNPILSEQPVASGIQPPVGRAGSNRMRLLLALPKMSRDIASAQLWIPIPRGWDNHQCTSEAIFCSCDCDACLVKLVCFKTLLANRSRAITSVAEAWGTVFSLIILKLVQAL